MSPESTMDTCKDNNCHLKSTVESLTQEIQRLENELKESKEESSRQITHLTDQVERSGKKYENLQAAWGDFISEKSALEDNVEELMSKSNALEESITVKDSRIQELSASNLELTTRIQEQGKQILNDEEKMKKLQLCVKKQDDKIKDLIDKLHKAEQNSIKAVKEFATQTDTKSGVDKSTATDEEQNSSGSVVDYEMKRWQSKVDHQLEKLQSQVEFLTTENLKLQLQNLVTPTPSNVVTADKDRDNMQLFIPHYPHNLNLNSTTTTTTAATTSILNNIDKNQHSASSSNYNMYTNTSANHHHHSSLHEMELPRKLSSSNNNNNNNKFSAPSSISGKASDIIPVKNSSTNSYNSFDINQPNRLNQTNGATRSSHPDKNLNQNKSNYNNNHYYPENPKSSLSGSTQQRFGKQHQQRQQKHHKMNHVNLKRCSSDDIYKPQAIKLTSIPPLLAPPTKLFESSSPPPPPLLLSHGSNQKQEQPKTPIVNSSVVYNQIPSQLQEQSQRPSSRNSNHHAETKDAHAFIPLQTVKANVRQNMEVYKSQNINQHVNSSNNVIKTVKEVQSTSVSPPVEHELSASGQKIFKLYDGNKKRFEAIDAVDNFSAKQNPDSNLQLQAVPLHRNYQHSFPIEVGTRKFDIKVWLTMRIAENGISQPEFFKICFPHQSLNAPENGSNPWSYGNCFIKLTFMDQQPLVVCSKTFQVSAMNGTCDNVELDPHWQCDKATLSLNKKDFDEFFLPGLESYKIRKEETALMKSKRAIKTPYKKNDDPFFIVDVELFLMYGTDCTLPGYSLEGKMQKSSKDLKLIPHGKCPRIYFKIDDQTDSESYSADPCYIKEYAPVLSACLRDSYVENGKIIENDDGSKNFHLPGVSKSTISTFLKFIQGELIKTDEIQELLELLEFSQKYLIVNLAEDCLNKLMKSQKYDLTSALESIASGYKWNLAALSELGKSYIETHGEELASEEGAKIYEAFMSRCESFFEL